MIKSPLGFIFAAAAIVLAVSPEARKAARKLAVKGTEMLLEVADQIKDRTPAFQAEIKDNQKHAEQPLLP
ncbi:hypothetical protein [Paenibacillus piri]|uniref:YtxH domain-containing protein n=1 Tax=Paenibacillus piri TaxID=2547395 RepID=A0A4R5KCX9_9BACL|nr:hypothetical protein [Paenibacillus piri]TDF93036.1 hypothetical protein E1757_28670 [Paenibacillus piri]